jgi:hypothetical protein
MSLKKYMFVDLLTSAIIGILVEFLGVFVLNKLIYAMIIPFAISLLIMMVVTTRWGSWGLVIVPVLALSTVLSGRLINPHEQFKLLYDWKLYISLIFSLSTFSLNYLWFKIFKDKKIKQTMGTLSLLGVIDIIISTLMLVLIYYMLTSQNLIMAFPIWGLYGYAILIIGTCILFKQGVLVDVKSTLKENYVERIEEEEFRMVLEEDEEDSSVEKGVL